VVRSRAFHPIRAKYTKTANPAKALIRRSIVLSISIAAASPAAPRVFVVSARPPDGMTGYARPGVWLPSFIPDSLLTPSPTQTIIPIIAGNILRVILDNFTKYDMFS
jgi:hypothetical protein